MKKNIKVFLLSLGFRVGMKNLLIITIKYIIDYFFFVIKIIIINIVIKTVQFILKFQEKLAGIFRIISSDAFSFNMP